MLDFKNLNRQELAIYGLNFETQEEAELFAAIIMEELQIRVGEAICNSVGETAADEFAHCETQEDEEAWFEKNCPDSDLIVKKTENELHREIMKFRDSIPGIVPDDASHVRDMSIDELDISVRSYNCLKRAGIDTVGKLMDYGDLSDIRNLGPKSAQEIHEKLMELISPEYAMREFLGKWGTNEDDMQLGMDEDEMLSEPDDELLSDLDYDDLLLETDYDELFLDTDEDDLLIP